MDNDIREMLRERADDMLAVPVLSPLTMQRAKRRRVGTMVGVGGMTLAAILGTIVGVNALRGPATIPFDSAIKPVLRHTIRFEGYVSSVRSGYGAVWVQSNDIGGTVYRVDPGTGRVTATVRPGLLPPAAKGLAPRQDRRVGSFAGLAVGQGAVWAIATPVEDAHGPVLAQPQGVQTFSSGGQTSATFSMQAQAIGSEPSPMQIETLRPTIPPTPFRPSRPPEMKQDQRWRIVRIDPRTTKVTIGPEIKNVWIPLDIAAGEGGIWVVGGGFDTGAVYRIDPKTLTLTDRIATTGTAHVVSAGSGSIWAGVADSGAEPGIILRIDPRTRKIVGRIRIQDSAPAELSVYGGNLWAMTLTGRLPTRVSLNRIDIEKVEGVPVSVFTRSKQTFSRVADVATGDGYLWVALDDARSVVWIDPTTGEIAGTAKVEGWPGAIAVIDDYLVVSNTRGNDAIYVYTLQSRR